MKIGIPAESRADEKRVAATPETIKKLIALGHQVLVAKDAGLGASITNLDYENSGASITSQNNALAAEVVFKVQTPNADELKFMQAGSILVGMLDPFSVDNVKALNIHSLSAFALERLPRITRAQSMDVLSSQANIAGYKAVLLATYYYTRFMPMLMTAAGTVKAARVLIIGAGVAGLQAIATAKRLGAVVEASDVRPAVKEQVESLGAKFLEVPFLTEEEKTIAEGRGGYAQSMPADWMSRQSELLQKRAQQADIIITTALIPGKAAPQLLSQETIELMKPGSVIVDLAVTQGGNCALSECGKIVNHRGITIVGETNIPSLMAADASALYARNVLDFSKLLFDDKGQFILRLEDEIINACLLCHQGQPHSKN